MVVDIFFKTTWWTSSQYTCHHNYFQDFSQMYIYSASQKKRKPINQVNFSENYNDISYCVCKYVQSNDQWNCTISCSHFTIIASVIILSYQFLTLALTFLLWPLSCLITPHKHPILHLFISLPLPPSPSSHIYDCKYLDDYVTVE